MMTGPRDPAIQASDVTSPHTEIQQPLATVQGSMNQNAIRITIHKLNGKNYLPWSQSMKLIVHG